MNVISLGHACQVAHQLRRIGVSKETHFFDWIVSHHDALIENLHLTLDHMLFSEGVEFDSRKIRLRDLATGLWFYGHDFAGAANRTGIVTESEVQEIREKYIRRSARTRLALSEQSVTVIRHFYDTSITQIEIQQTEIISRLRELYPETHFSFLWTSELRTDGYAPPKGHMFHTPKGSDWKGDDRAWDIICENIGMLG